VVRHAHGDAQRRPYLDTLYSAFEMVASGVTTVQHLHGWAPGSLDEVRGLSNQVIKAYEDIGMRVSYCYALRDQNRLVYQADEDFVASLPAELRGVMRNWFARFRMSTADHASLFESLHAAYDGTSRVRIQLAPANLHWCSDEALTMLGDLSRRYDVPMHMHLLEIAFQKEYARRRGGGTALDYVQRFGLLGPKLTLGHGVWLNEADIDKVAETGTCTCHNCSSNFRLRSGLAPLNVFEAKGIKVGIGIDEAGINDDRDMLQEMRMVLRAHRTPGMDDEVPTIAQVFYMATQGGAATTAFGPRIGRIAPGMAADLLLVDCALSNDEVERRRLSHVLLPHVKAFDRDYFRRREPPAVLPAKFPYVSRARLRTALANRVHTAAVRPECRRRFPASTQKGTECRAALV
jgi:5-methylthioadenosine/S-adenosylhomocysteine deaminase